MHNLLVFIIPLYDDIIGLLGISVILSSLYMQGQSYVDPIIRAIAIQSLFIAILIAILFLQNGDINLLYLAIITAAMRVIVFPKIMLYQVRHFKHSLREKGSNQKTPSLMLIGIIVVIIGYTIFKTVLFPLIPDTQQASIPFILLLLGFLLIITRRDTLAQISGYIQEENAILYIGAIITPGIQLLTEFAVVLDIFGVVILGVILSKQRNVFRTLDREVIEQLKG